MTSAASSEPRFVQPHRYRPIGNFRDAALGQLRLDTPSMQSDLSSGTLYKPCLSDGSRCPTTSQIGKKPRFHCFFSRLLPYKSKTKQAGHNEPVTQNVPVVQIITTGGTRTSRIDTATGAAFPVVRATERAEFEPRGIDFWTIGLQEDVGVRGRPDALSGSPEAQPPGPRGRQHSKEDFPSRAVSDIATDVAAAIQQKGVASLRSLPATPKRARNAPQG